MIDAAEGPTTTDRDRSVFRAHDIIREFTRFASSAAGEDPAALVSLLRQTLPAHFAYEERAGGFFDQLEQRGVASPLLERLRGEHREVLAVLDRLEQAVARGDEVTSELSALAQLLRDHEWIESVSAVRAQLVAPGDILHEPGPARTSLPPNLRPGLESLADEVVTRAAQPQAGLLSGIQIEVPRNCTAETVRDALEDLLSERGVDFVDITTCLTDGPLALIGTRYEHVV